MNKIFNKLLLTGCKFMPELHLRQPGFTFSCLLTKHPGKINPKYDGYQRILASMVYEFFFGKKTGSGTIANEKLAQELHNW